MSRRSRRTWLGLAVMAWAALAVVAFLWVLFNEQTDNLVTSFLCWLGGVAFWAVAYGLWERRRREATHEKIDALEAHIDRLQNLTKESP